MKQTSHADESIKSVTSEAVFVKNINLDKLNFWGVYKWKINSSKPGYNSLLFRNTFMLFKHASDS